MSVCFKYNSSSSVLANCYWDSADHHAWVRWRCGFLRYHNPFASNWPPKPCLLLSLRQDSPDVLWESGWAGAFGACVGQMPWLSLLPCLGKYPIALSQPVPAVQVVQNTVLVCGVTRQKRKTVGFFFFPLCTVNFPCAHCFRALQRIHKTLVSRCQG